MKDIKFIDIIKQQLVGKTVTFYSVSSGIKLVKKVKDVKDVDWTSEEAPYPAHKIEVTFEGPADPLLPCGLGGKSYLFELKEKISILN